MSAHPDHVEVLRSGPTAWNTWREENPSIIPDLGGIALKLSERQMGPINGGPINLKSALLQEAMLRFATLSAAELENADLSGVDLVHARLDRANLKGANLSGAQLNHANFAEANLSNANLCGASLSFANLTAADLEAADMNGADFAHARFDDANLRAANLSFAFLDHADFAGANLTKANLCGANLSHSKNLTEAQLKETTGSDSTILPPHLQGTVSWSVARRLAEPPALARPDLRLRARDTTHLDGPQFSSYNRPAWIAGMCLVGGMLLTIGFVWQRMNEPIPLVTSDTQTGPSLSEPKISSNADEARLQPGAPEAQIEEKAADEHQRSADAETPSLPADAVDRTESSPEQSPVPETDSATVPQEANPNGELQASGGALSEQAPIRDVGHDKAPEASPLVSAESLVATSRHGTVPDLTAEPSEASALVSAESPVTKPPHGTVPDLPAEASIPNQQLTPAAEASAEALTLSTSEPTADSPVGDTVPPSVVTGALPSSAEQKDVETVLPLDAGSPPMPVRKPNIQKEVANPGLAGTSPKPFRKSVTQKGDVDSKPDRSRQAKGQSFVDKKAAQGPGSGSITDLLAGGL